VTSGMPSLGAQSDHGSGFSLQRGRSPQNWSVQVPQGTLFCPSVRFPNDGC
jgi:hypothetical protein